VSRDYDWSEEYVESVRTTRSPAPNRFCRAVRDPDPSVGGPVNHAIHGGTKGTRFLVGDGLNRRLERKWRVLPELPTSNEPDFYEMQFGLRRG
jgi:hypothetical protein